MYRARIRLRNGDIVTRRGTMAIRISCEAGCAIVPDPMNRIPTEYERWLERDDEPLQAVEPVRNIVVEPEPEEAPERLPKRRGRKPKAR